LILPKERIHQPWGRRLYRRRLLSPLPCSTRTPDFFEHFCCGVFIHHFDRVTDRPFIFRTALLMIYHSIRS
jgi:hypothetical protein